MCVLCVYGGRGRIGYNLILITIYLDSRSLSYLFVRISALSKILMLLPKVNRWFKKKYNSIRKCKMRTFCVSVFVSNIRRRVDKM